MSSGRSRRGGISRSTTPEAVVQVAAKALRLDLRLEAAVGGGDDPHVDWDEAVRTDRADLFFLERAEELGLQIQRDLADLIEKQRALVGQLESSHDASWSLR